MPPFNVARLFIAMSGMGALSVQSQIEIPDPFVLPDHSRKIYHLYSAAPHLYLPQNDGIEDSVTVIFAPVFDGISGVHPGIQAIGKYQSSDLAAWDTPTWVSNHNGAPAHEISAPEIHFFQGRYYLIVTEMFLGGRPSSIRILSSATPEGPFQSFGNRQTILPGTKTRDATLWVENDVPHLVYAHAVTRGEGRIERVQLSDDLNETIGEPKLLFPASAGPWVQEIRADDFPDLSNYTMKTDEAAYRSAGEPTAESSWSIWDASGPWLYRTKTDELVILWSNKHARGRAVGIARSESGSIEGPWIHNTKPVWTDEDDLPGMMLTTAGLPTSPQPMLFKSFDERLIMLIGDARHQPHFFEMEDFGDSLRIKQELPFPK